MLNILSGTQVKVLDRAYISSENIESWQLMERAANQFADWLVQNFPDFGREVIIFCGPGNNGGDGLAIARLISETYKCVMVVFFEESGKCSADYQTNWRRLPNSVSRIFWRDFQSETVQNPIVIDGIFGVGINRPVEGVFLEGIRIINRMIGDKIAIDVPSGIPADDCLKGEAVKADYTVTFQFPKLSLLFPEHAAFVGKMLLKDIGIPEQFLGGMSEGRLYVQYKDIPSMHRRFNQFSHKGDFGRVLLIGGKTGKVGSMVLAAKATLRTGSGLVFVSVPSSEKQILQISVPEAMVADNSELRDLSKYDAIGIGPGWGLEIDPDYFAEILRSVKRPVVIDADGLNLLAKYPRLFDFVPSGSILTPHLKEFERIVSGVACHRDRLEKAMEFARKHQIYIVLKGAYTSISCPDGSQYFNSSGNKFMATAGSGDVLTGVLSSFLGQGYHPKQAALCGVFHHGMAGDLAGAKKNRGLIASDIIESIPETFVQMKLQ
ncbi:NAD(P)H-hydrate dehydratase [Mariniradius sediminis]|uniref:Bifunctional NAD(P)H-hydrate repair enzyme n=1 Tax=Mariniradius sediminis TaxID=2909237 RepID=A0ABS9BPJ4_9BACT|nr:NAD(P)H-hydrate dehydratase [Mariniradius sediminis]MCF1749980.1 NAD(P)H-hydrate dehydratase [Mariniradius sediminis]